MKRHVTLDYTLGTGWLDPWLEGLRAGKAVASICSACDQAQFPPVRVCPDCRVTSSGWFTLEGGATLVFRTVGTDGDFAMVQFDGAASAAIARTDTLPEGATRATLAPCPCDPPTLSLIAEPLRHE